MILDIFTISSVNNCINRCFSGKSIQTFHLHLFMLYRLLGSMRMILDIFTISSVNNCINRCFSGKSIQTFH